MSHGWRGKFDGAWTRAREGTLAILRRYSKQHDYHKMQGGMAAMYCIQLYHSALLEPPPEELCKHQVAPSLHQPGLNLCILDSIR